MSSPKQLAGKGVSYLEEAILDVLLEAWEKEKYSSIFAVKIKKRIGVGDWDRDQRLTTAILVKLKEEGRVKRRGERGPWQLTDAEYAKRSNTEGNA